MRNDELNVRCVLALGWTMHRNPNHHGCGASIPKYEAMIWENYFVPPEFKGDTTYNRGIPKFATYLDACAQLRASLTEEERKIYVCELALLSADNIGGDFRDWFWTIANATATDHCRAFLAAKQAL